MLSLASTSSQYLQDLGWSHAFNQPHARPPTPGSFPSLSTRDPLEQECHQGLQDLLGRDGGGSWNDDDFVEK
ncbi:MAG: hypothetical protein HYY11_02610 [Candidatus Methylomirabilis oxyfera]|nr:hypothetical protein [Candidatus Methylomirabilis oxyfera]